MSICTPVCSTFPQILHFGVPRSVNIKFMIFLSETQDATGHTQQQKVDRSEVQISPLDGKERLRK